MIELIGENITYANEKEAMMKPTSFEVNCVLTPFASVSHSLVSTKIGKKAIKLETIMFPIRT